MPDYNLAGLSPSSFEQLIQSLAARVIGPGTVIFGLGPDGGREATFEGKMQYPSQAGAWNGYLVVQAKFLQRPHSTSRDGEWALKQLKPETRKFSDAQRGLRKPEYYLFCTNVVLSPVDEIGYKDQILEAMRVWGEGFGLKGYDVWDYDKLRAFLDANCDIQRTYAAWITPGDVLQTVIGWVGGLQADFDRVMSQLLQSDLLDDRYVRLDQAGYADKERTPVAKVFVDLPAGTSLDEEPEEDEDEQALKRGFLEEIIIEGGRRLDPASAEGIRTHDKPRQRSGRYVLIGGPGQGKTTLSQYLCQLYRVSILKDKRHLAPEVEDAVELIQRQCSKGGIAFPSGRRFPIRIVLNEFAHYLAKNPNASLTSFIIDIVRHRTDTEIRSADLLKWLGAYPWLLVLDGLDEVPTSANREDVISAVTKFLAIASDCGADLLVVATSRPQGLSANEFSPDYYRHRFLMPLSKQRALHYGRRLASVMHGEDSTAARDVIEKLEAAIADESTARLMRSPLQVTIMAALARKGPLPRERWLLFSRYYDVIYERETAKRTGAAEILVRYRKDIDAIHHRVGLALQIQCETTGQTTARMPKTRFAEIVHARLDEEGSPPENLTCLAKQIIEAAEHRLVFLVGVQAGQVGFEIRSLQEYMAAEALMDGDDASVVERLKAIAPVWHWRNVFLFAVGKCFNQKRHLRETIVGMCTTMNVPASPDDVFAQCSPGAQLALDILQDGLAFGHWTYERTLISTACAISRRPPCEGHARLAGLFTESLRDVFNRDVFPGIGGAAIFGMLADRGHDWATDKADDYWPRSSTDSLPILRFGFSQPHGRYMQDRLCRAVPDLSVSELRKVGFELWRDAPGWLADLHDLVGHQRSAALDCKLPGGLRAELVSVEAGESSFIELADMPAQRGCWKAIVSAARFNRRPSPDSLAAALRGMAENWDDLDLGAVQTIAAWPLAAAVDRCNCPDDLLRLSESARAGELGIPDDWVAAEARWRANGETWEGLLEFERQGELPGPMLRQSGFPGTIASFWASGSDADDLTALLQTREKSRSVAVRGVLASLALWLARLGKRRVMEPDLVVDSVRIGRYFGLELLEKVPPRALMTESWLDAMEYVGNNATVNAMRRPVWSSLSETIGALARAFAHQPTRLGLIPLLARALASGVRVTVENVPDWDRIDRPRLRLAAMLIRIADRRCPPEELKEIARELAQGAPHVSHTAVSDAVSISRQYQSRNLAPFMCEMLRSCGETDWRVRDILFAAIDDICKARRGDLHKPTVARKLRLPICSPSAPYSGHRRAQP